MSCDGPDCDNVQLAPYLGWWHLVPASTIQFGFPPRRMDFCSWECLGAFVMEQAGGVADFEQRIRDLDDT